MKIYFEDGELRADFTLSPRPDFRIDASLGPSANEKSLNEILENNPNAVVYTNSLIALSNRYCWDSRISTPELYIRGEKMSFQRVDSLTEREIREAHNLLYMYLNGAFQ